MSERRRAPGRAKPAALRRSARRRAAPRPRGRPQPARRSFERRARRAPPEPGSQAPHTARPTHPERPASVHPCHSRPGITCWYGYPLNRPVFRADVGKRARLFQFFQQRGVAPAAPFGSRRLTARPLPSLPCARGAMVSGRGRVACRSRRHAERDDGASYRGQEPDQA